MASSKELINAKQLAIAELAAARANLGPQWNALAQQARPTHIIQQSVKNHRLWWIGGALVAGFVGIRAILPASNTKNRRDTSAKSAKTSGILALIASPILGMARKATLSWLATQFQLYLQSTVKTERPH